MALPKDFPRSPYAILRRLVVKMATGSDKTKVMSLVLAWCYFHKLYEPDSDNAAKITRASIWK